MLAAGEKPKDILDFKFRANPEYELVQFERLSQSDQRILGSIGDDPDGYGILRPRNDSPLGTKSVSRDTALLLLMLQTGGPLPRSAVSALGDRCKSVVTQMVLDGILEIEIEGNMVSGPAAHRFIIDSPLGTEGKSRLAKLSYRALEHAEALDLADPSILAGRIYAFNRIPVSARWSSLLPDEPATEHYLGIDRKLASKLGESWYRLPRANGWICWQSLQPAASRRVAATYKLYVSPACTNLRAAFAATMETVSRSAAFHVKVGSDAYGLLRPDKLVAYFLTFADLQATADEVLERLNGCPAQGVPFTAQIGRSALLSWGVDPPADEHTVPWLKRESWRSRISNRLAVAICMAKALPSPGVSPSRFAMDRLQIEGIDTTTWAPTSSLSWSIKP